MQPDLVSMGMIPLDKSWMIRMGFLDLINGYDDTIEFLREQKVLNDDLKSLLNASIDWFSGSTTIDVGESGTLYRFLKFASWKLNLKKTFLVRGTLPQRKICDDPSIINHKLEDLMKLDGGTSQWASAAVLMGNADSVGNPPYKLRLTYKALAHWKEARERERRWDPIYDRTILVQALAFLKILKHETTGFVPKHSEDYCFSRAFGMITSVDGENRWPSLRGHESNRINSMEEALAELENGKEISSRDHRVVQSVCMLGVSNGIDMKIEHPECVNKSWPQFWDFIKFASGKKY